MFVSFDIVVHKSDSSVITNTKLLVLHTLVFHQIELFFIKINCVIDQTTSMSRFTLKTYQIFTMLYNYSILDIIRRTREEETREGPYAFSAVFFLDFLGGEDSEGCSERGVEGLLPFGFRDL